jgi:hypothetical protein
MTGKTDQRMIIDTNIERWHCDFERLNESWALWCEENATKYNTASQAWSAFIDEQRPKGLTIDFSPC